jgi:hypothetical protein
MPWELPPWSQKTTVSEPIRPVEPVINTFMKRGRLIATRGERTFFHFGGPCRGFHLRHSSQAFPPIFKMPIPLLQTSGCQCERSLVHTLFVADLKLFAI